MNIEKIRQALVKPYWRNPRHNEKTVESLMESITKFGFNVPITIDKNNVIITGHTRYKAAIKLKGELISRIVELKKQGKTDIANNLETINNGYIFAIKPIDLTDEQVKEFRIADNKIGDLSTWDEDALKFELRELENIVGFSDKEIDDLLKEKILYESYTDDEIKEAERAIGHHYADISKQGDLIEVICPLCQESFFINRLEVLKEK